MIINPLRIAILGGCLNSGYHVIRLNQLYHRIMARSLEQLLGRTVRVTLGRFDTHQHSGMIKRVAELITACKPNMLLFQIRPDFLWGLYSAAWLTRDGSGFFRLRKNPHLQYGNIWPQGMEESINPMHRFAAQNLQISQMLGVTQQAHGGLARRLKDLKILAEKENISLGLISPIFGTYYHPQFQKFAREKIFRIITESNLPMVDLMTNAEMISHHYWADAFHPNVAGHQLAAQIATQTLLPILKNAR